MQIENNQNNGAMGYLTGFTLTAYNKSGSTISTGGVASGTLPSTNTWYHVVCTRDTNYFKVYVNGCLMATSSSQNGALPYYGTNTPEARIGSRRNGSKYFNGVLDEISIYNCALSAKEVSKLYHGNQVFSVNNDTTICADAFKSFKLKASKNYCSYSWIDINSRSTVLGTDSHLLINITASKTYRVFNQFGDSATVKVTILPKPVLDLGNDTAYCGNYARILDGGNFKIKEYLWNTGSTNRTIIADSGRKYKVQVTDSNGCISTDSITIIKNPLPISGLQNDTLICGAFTKILDAGPDGVKYSWGIYDSLRTLYVNSKGLYKVKITNQFSCSVFDSILILNPIINAGFLISDSVHCFATNSFKIKDTSNYFDDSRLRTIWYFGDGTQKSDTVVNKVYTDTGLFQIKQFIESINGCKDSVVKSVRIYPSTNINFSINEYQQCFNGNSFDFLDSSFVYSSLIENYFWSFGDDSIHEFKNKIGKKYIKDSIYKVTLITRTSENCYDTLSKVVSVHPNSNINFNISNDSQCFNYHSVSIQNLTSIRTGNVSQYTWYFGDGDSSNLKDITSKRYSLPDTFEVKLVTLSDYGCLDTLSKTVSIFPNAQLDFNVNKDTQCFEWNSFDFSNTSSISNGTIQFHWDFNDATFFNGIDTTGKKFSQFGEYYIQLSSVSDNYCRDTIGKYVSVLASPVANFSIDKEKQCYRGNLFNFTNLSSINNGLLNANEWLLGNGDSSKQTNVFNYPYSSEDTFLIRLIVSSELGCLDTIHKSAITFAQPVADFNVPNDSQCWQKNYFNLLNQTKLKYGIMNHYWDFGDGTTDTSYSPSTKQYPNKSDDYILNYKVISDNGCRDSGFKRIVLLERPIAGILVNDSIQCFRSHLFKFNNTTTFSAMSTVSYFWDYGNGSSSVGFVPSDALYITPVYQTVSLIAYSYLTNCYDTVYQRILPAPHAVPDFTVNNDSQCLRNNNYIFTNNSTISLGSMSYLWKFGDLDTSSLFQPTKNYNIRSEFNVKLIASSNFGCIDSISHKVVVLPHPKSLFGINDTAQCLNSHSFDFINNTSIEYGDLYYKWVFDNTDSVKSKDVSNKEFSNPGEHKVSLFAVSEFNCTDSVSRDVFLENFGNTLIAKLSPDSQCLKGNLFKFSGSSNNTDVNHVSYKWLMGDGIVLLNSTPEHIYKNHGNFNVTLESTSGNYCKDTQITSVTVHPHPITSFNQASVCFPESVNFNTTSTIVNGFVKSYYWEFEDGGFSYLKDPVHKYNAPGIYKVIHVSTSDFNCSDTFTEDQGAIVKEKPLAAFSFIRLSDKQFDVATIKFRNLSYSNIVASRWEFSDGNSSAEFEPEQDFIDTFSRKVVLIVTNDKGCMDTAFDFTGPLITDFVFYLPDAFSPGNNSINDIFKPIATPYVRSYVMEIFNRWGEKVFATNDIGSGWDGNFQGVECEQGVYLVRVYLIPMRGRIQHFEQTVTLLR